jgi:hypothetical protein
MEGKINTDNLITHVLPLERINEGLDLMHEGKSIRSVVTYDRARARPASVSGIGAVSEVGA